MTDREPSNKLRVDLYRKLLPFIQRQDQGSGEHGYILHWDDPEFVWDSDDVTSVWDALGLDPVLQELFWVIETLEGEDLEVLESIDALTDPLKCPEPLLGDIAASFGYRLAEGLDEKAKRTAILGLFDAAKTRGRRISFDVYYRLAGFKLLKVSPLWKKDINEANGDYSTVRYETAPITNTPVGPSGIQTYTGRFADVPIEPGTLRITSGSTVLRDDGEGGVIGPTTESGTVNYNTGDFTIAFAGLTASPVTATFNKVTEEWPYHAARIDLTLSISPGGAPIPLVDGEFVGGLLARLEEVRPIHVLLRTFALVAEVEDQGPGATDEAACTTEGDDDRDGVPSVPTTGRRHRYFVDQAVRGDDDANVQTVVGGVTTKMNVLFDDLGAGICPVDVLIIEAGSNVYYV